MRHCAGHWDRTDDGVLEPYLHSVDTQSIPDHVLGSEMSTDGT